VTTKNLQIIQVIFLGDNIHAHYRIAFFDAHAAHARGGAAHGADIFFIKAYGLATFGGENYVVIACGIFDPLAARPLV
jgi:hypothetical protein